MPDAKSPDKAYQEVLFEVVQWGQDTFPHSTIQTVVTHLRRECLEWQLDPCNPEEMADVLMLIAHLRCHLTNLEQQVHRVALQYHLDITDEIRKKLAINRARSWGAPDEEGVVEHVRREGGDG